MIVFFPPDDGMEVFIKSRYEGAMSSGDFWEFVIMNVKGTISGVQLTGLDSVYHDAGWDVRGV